MEDEEMIIDIDKAIAANKELLDVGDMLIHRPFLGPKGIQKAVEAILRATAYYNDICMVLIKMKGAQNNGTDCDDAE
jgi:hypothetical protein